MIEAARAAEMEGESPSTSTKRKTGKRALGRSISMRNPLTGETTRVSDNRPLGEGEYDTLRQALVQDSANRLGERQRDLELRQRQQWANAAFRNRQSAKAFDARVAMAQVRSDGAFEAEGEETLAGMAKRVRLAKEVRGYLEASPDKKDASVRAAQKWDARSLADASDDQFYALREKLEAIKTQKASLADARLNAKAAPRVGESEVKSLSRKIDLIDAARRYIDNGMSVPEVTGLVGTRAVSGVGDIEALIARRDDLAKEAAVAKSSAKNAVRFNVRGTKDELAFAKSQLDSALKAGWLRSQGFEQEARVTYGDDALKADAVALAERVRQIEEGIKAQKASDSAVRRSDRAEKQVQDRIKANAAQNASAFAAPQYGDGLQGKQSRLTSQIRLASMAQDLAARSGEDLALAKFGESALRADVDALRAQLSKVNQRVEAELEAARKKKGDDRAAARAQQRREESAPERATAFSAPELGYDEDGQRQRLQRQIRMAAVAQGLAGRGDTDKARIKYGDEALNANVPELRERLREIDRSRAALAEASRQTVLRTQFEAPDLDPLKRLERQIQMTTRAYALMEAGQEKAARAKFGDAAVDAHLPTLQRDLRDEQERRVREEHATSAVRAQARFDAKGWSSADGRAYTSQGIEIAEAKALVGRFGEDRARKTLGDKSFLVDLIPHLDTFVGKSAEAEHAGQKFNRMLWDGHSAARGLAGAMDQMWLTWGSTIPLIAGAALGGALRSVFENGKDVEYQLTFVSALSGETAASLTQLGVAMGGTMVGPKQAAEAMRGLAQNGLSTAQALSVLPDILRLATVGEMSLSDAALGATGVMEAFGLTVADIGRVSDVFSKAAAISNTSVGGMVEAMKQASTVADQYGMSLEETAATLAVLAKRNIEGSSAGTAVRNMMTELAAPTKASREAMAALGLQVYDDKGKLKDYGSILEEVRAKTEGLNEKSRLAYLHAIFGERGGKAANALLTDLDAYGQKLEEIRTKSEGFTKEVEDSLAGTTEGRLKRMVAEFQLATSRAFSDGDTGAKGAIDDLILHLTSTFSSQEFVNGARQLATALAEVGQVVVSVTGFLVEHERIITTVAGALVTYGLASKAASATSLLLGGVAQKLTTTFVEKAAAATAASSAVGGTTTALGAATAAAGTASGALTSTTGALNTAAGAAGAAATSKITLAGAASRLASGLTLLQGALGWVGIALTAATLAYELFSRKTDETTESLRRQNEELERNNKAGAKRLSTLQEQIEFQRKVNEGIQSGMSPDEARQRAGGNASVTGAQEQLRKAQADAEAADGRVNAILKAPRAPGVGLGLREQSQLKDAQDQAKAARKRADELKVAYDQAQAEHKLATEQARVNALPGQISEGQKFNADLVRYSKQNPKALSLLVSKEDQELDPEKFRELMKSRAERLNELKDDKALPTRGPKPSTVAAAQAAKATAQAEQERVRAELRLIEESQKAKEDILKRDKARGETDEIGYQQRLFAIQRDGLMKRVSFMEEGQRPQMLAAAKLMRGSQEPGWGMVQTLRTAYENGRESGDMVSAFMPLAAGDKERTQRANAMALLDIYLKQEDALGKIAAMRVSLSTLEAEGAANIADAVRRTDEKNEKAAEKVVNGLASVAAPEKDDSQLSLDTLFVSSEERTRSSMLRLARSIADARAAVDKTVSSTINDVRELRKALEAQLKGADSEYESATKEAERYEGLAANASGDKAAQLRTKAVDFRERAVSAAERSQRVTTSLEKLPTEAEIRDRGEKRKDGIELEKRSSVVDKYLNAKTPGGTTSLSKEDKAFGQASEAMQEMLALYARYQDAIVAAKDNEIELAAVRGKSMKDGLAGSATMLSSLRAFTKEGSSGYERMYRIERGLRTAQMALTLKDYATKGLLMAGNVAAHVVGEATKTSATATGEATRTAVTSAEEATRNLLKVPGVFMSFMSQLGPWGWAAAAAAIAALGLAGVGGGGGSYDANTDDTGSVLGDKSAKSESVSKSIDRLADVDTMTMRYSAAMLTSLRSIEASFAGVASLLFRNGGIESAMPGIVTGYQPRSSITGTQGEFMKIGSALHDQRVLNALGPLGGALNNAYSRVSNILFGTKVSVQGQGIALQSGNLADIVRGGLNSSYFADIETKKKLFGFSTGAKRSTVYSAMDDEMSSQFNKIIHGFYDTLTTAAPLLGQSLESVMANLANTQFGGLKIDLKDKTGDQVVEALNSQFSKIGDTMARSVLPGLSEFSKVGEGYLETTIRVATGLESARGALRSLGVQAVSLSDVINKMGDVDTEVVRQSIGNIERIGGELTSIGQIIKNFEGSGTEIADAYRQLKNVQVSLKSMGLTATSVSYDLIQGAGGLENLMSGLSSYEDNFLTKGGKLRVQSAHMKEEFGRLGLVMPKTIEGFRKLVETLGNAGKVDEYLLGQVLGLSDGFSEMVGTLKELGQSVEEEIKRIRGLMVLDSANSHAALQTKFAITTAQARSGDADALDELAKISQDLLSVAAKQAGSSQELARERAEVAASMEATLAIARSNVGDITITDSSSADAKNSRIVADAVSQLVQGKISLTDFIQVTRASAFANGGYHAGGWRLVGENGPELESTGAAMYYTAAQTQDILSGGRSSGEGDDDLARVVDALRKEVVALRADQERQAAAIAGGVSKVARTLQQAMPDGDSLQVKMA